MGFSPSQLRQLRANLRPDVIRARERNGRRFQYIESWHAISEANRIFGFDSWNRETVETKCVLARETRGTYYVIYLVKARIIVTAKDRIIVRDGYGTGDAQTQDAAEAHDKAVKTAETDATKRALATFGNPFGLELYLGHRDADIQSNLVTNQPTDIQRRRTARRLGSNGHYYLQTSRKRSPATVALDLQQREADPATRDKSSSDPMQSVPSIIADTTTVPTLPISHPPRRRDRAHLRFVALQPCLLCGRTPSDPHHLRFAQQRAMGRKVSDEFTVPLCRTHHRQLHQGGNEVDWWNDMDIDPLSIAQDLWNEFQARPAHGVSPADAAVTSPNAKSSKSAEK
jgi:DNA recombination protein Rad52